MPIDIVLIFMHPNEVNSLRESKTEFQNRWQEMQDMAHYVHASSLLITSLAFLLPDAANSLAKKRQYLLRCSRRAVPGVS